VISFRNEQSTAFGVFPQETSSLTLPGLWEYAEEVTLPFTRVFDLLRHRRISWSFADFMDEQSELAGRNCDALVRASVYCFKLDHRRRWELFSLSRTRFENDVRQRLIHMLALHLKSTNIRVFDLQLKPDLRHLEEFRKALGGPIALPSQPSVMDDSRSRAPIDWTSHLLHPPQAGASRKIIIVAESTVVIREAAYAPILPIPSEVPSLVSG